MPQIKPRAQTPNLEFQTLDGTQWKLNEQAPENFTMVVAYRGLHCPKCEAYLRELDRHADDFKTRGVNVVTVSGDTQERAQTAKENWRIQNLPIGYGLTIGSAREWGMYISKGHGKTSAGIEEPAEFNEPGLFIIRPDGTLYWVNISSMPFARPNFKEILGALDFAIEKNYPARGEA